MWLVVSVLVSMAADAQSGPLPSGVSLETTGAGHYVTANGRSLYWTDKDVSAGDLTCVEECLERWTPLAPAPDAVNIADWSILERPDGGRQWAYKDKPLYTYIMDTFPGARLGDGRDRRWHVMFEPAGVPAGMGIASTLLGRVLTDNRGRTLYTTSQPNGPDGAATIEDSGPWQAFAAPWLAVGQGDWSIRSHARGMRQWAYKGQDLFSYEKDTDPRDIRGHGLDGVWTAVILEPAPGLPPWMTIQHVDLGLAYADEKGMTIYAPADMQAIKVAQTCPPECMKKYWRPIIAKPEESSIGRWVILENDAGQRQWSYGGRFLYTHTRDQKPGDMVGNGYAVGYRIGDGWRVILVQGDLRPLRS